MRNEHEITLVDSRHVLATNAPGEAVDLRGSGKACTRRQRQGRWSNDGLIAGFSETSFVQRRSYRWGPDALEHRAGLPGQDDSVDPQRRSIAEPPASGFCRPASVVAGRYSTRSALVTDSGDDRSSSNGGWVDSVAPKTVDGPRLYYYYNDHH